MNTIDTFIKVTQEQMLILRELNYHIDSSNTYNEGDDEVIFCRLVFVNVWSNREITLDFAPRREFTLDVFITDTENGGSFSLNSYLIYKETKQPVMPPYKLFTIDKDNFESSLIVVLQQINTLLSGELRPVVAGKQMIRVPVVDLRDFY